MYDVFDSPLNELAPFPVPDEELLERYERLFTAIVADVLDEVYLRDNCVLPSYLKPLTDGTKVAGFAFTMKGVRTHIPETMNDFSARMAKIINDFKTNDIVMWDTGSDVETSHYGEMMARTSMSMGCKGAVVDGGLRDSDRVLEMGFKVWYKFRTPRSAFCKHRVVAWQVPIRIQDVTVCPGDLVFGDMDGVVVVPRELAYDVLVECERRCVEEKGWREILDSGISAQEAFARGVQF